MSHWYTQDGSPCHTVDKKGGGWRDTTLRDARKMDLSPSVTEIMKIVSAPALVNYFLRQQLETAWEYSVDEQRNCETLHSDYSSYATHIKKVAAEHSTKARDKGISIHHQLDRYYKGKTPTMEANYVEAVSEALQEAYGIKVGNVTPEATFARDGYGGAVDLSNPEVCIDFKWKADGFSEKDKLTYDNHFGQLAAYRYGLGFIKAKCVNVFIGGGGKDIQVRIVEHTSEESEWGLEYFRACQILWQITKKYKPMATAGRTQGTLP